MGQNRSVTDYAANRFYNELFVAMQDYVRENGDDLDLQLYRIKNIGGIALLDIEVKFVSINNIPILSKVS